MLLCRKAINRDFFEASLFSYSGERSGMVGLFPGLAISLNEQRFRRWAAVDGRAQLRRETGRDRHRTVCDFLPSAAFA